MIEELRQQYFSFLVDVGFVQATVQEKRELISTRYGRSKVRFVRVPDEMDGFSKDPKAVMACIAASLYPKLLVVDSASNSMKTLANSSVILFFHSMIRLLILLNEQCDRCDSSVERQLHAWTKERFCWC